jgi:hypothetical protein
VEDLNGEFSGLLWELAKALPVLVILGFALFAWLL